MEWFILLLCLIGIIILFIRVSQQGSEIKDLQIKLSQMLAIRLKDPSISGITDKSQKKTSVEEIKPAAKTKPNTEIIQETPATAVKIPSIAQPAKSSLSTSKTTDSDSTRNSNADFWKKIEKQFIENWTGVLGIGIVVLGVGFLAIYAALNMPAMIRFLMLAGFSVLTFGLSYYLMKNPEFKDLALWVRSGSAAVFLFACLGSGYIHYLKWIENTPGAIALLVFGVVVNTYSGFISRSQIVASVHAILSLIALSVAKPDLATFIVVQVIVLGSMLIIYKEKWEYYLVVILGGSWAYHLYWFNSLHKEGPDTASRLTGIISILAIGTIAAMTHYRGLYRYPKLKPLPFITHLFTWFYLGMGLFMHATGFKWNTVILFLLSAAVFTQARCGKKLEVNWLFSTDTVVAQLLMLFCISSLEKWGLSVPWMLMIMAIQLTGFIAYTAVDENKFLHKFASIIAHLLSGTIIIAIASGDHIKASHSDLHNGLLLITLLLQNLFVLQFSYKKWQGRGDLYFPVSEGRSIGLAGLMTGLILSAAYFQYQRFFWILPAFGILLSVLLYLRKYWSASGLGVGLVLPVFIVIAHSWVKMWETGHDLGMQLQLCVPLFILTTAIYLFTELKARPLRSPGVYLITAHVVYSTLIIGDIYSPYISGILFLCYATILLELSGSLRKKHSDKMSALGNADHYILYSGFALLGIFWLRHLAVYLQSQQYLGIFRIRLLLELFALTVTIFWATYKAPETESRPSAWDKAKPLTWELAVLNTVLIVFAEFSSDWFAPSWIWLALMLLIVGHLMKPELSRFRFYSLFFHWIGSFYIAFVSGAYQEANAHPGDIGWWKALGAILLQFLYLILYYRQADLASVTYPEPLRFFTKLTAAIGRRPFPWVYYPFFLSTALFLFWTFDHSLLTLLWVGEAFVIFLLGAFLRESQFRYVAQVGLVGCLIRLIFFDLSQSKTVTRAIVFLGVGSLMVLMNFLYQKYKDRFQPSGIISDK